MSNSRPAHSRLRAEKSARDLGIYKDRELARMVDAMAEGRSYITETPRGELVLYIVDHYKVELQWAKVLAWHIVVWREEYLTASAVLARYRKEL